jgi:hypothetical protein
MLSLLSDLFHRLQGGPGSLPCSGARSSPYVPHQTPTRHPWPETGDVEISRPRSGSC